MYLLPFPILGGLLAWATVYLLGFKKQRWAGFVLGLAAFFIAMFVQSPIQQLPLLAMGIRSNADIIARGMAFTVGASIWIGLVAGLVQEGTKYVLIKGKSLNTGLFMGLGFGITEVFVIAGAAFIGAIVTGQPLDVPVDTAVLSMVERYFAVLFHVGTGIYLAYARSAGFGRNGLLAMIGIHTVMDSFSAYYQLTKSESVLYTVEVIAAVTALLLLYHTIPKAKLELSGEEEGLR